MDAPRVTAPDRAAQGRRDDATRVIVGHLVLPDGTTVSVSEGQRLLLGSAADCAVRLVGDRLAPHHCVIDASAEDLLVEDLGTEGGTRLNGHPVQRTLLSHGDVLTVGGQTLRLTTTAGALRDARRARARRIARWALPAVGACIALLVCARLLAPCAVRWLAGAGPQAPILRRVSVTSEPAGAWVWLDGAYRGETPLALDVAVSAEHRVRITADGYQDWERVLPPGGDVHAVLAEHPRGTLAVEAFPAHATLLVDGRRLGSCPTRIAVPAGERVVRVECQGYEAAERIVTVRAGETAALRCVLRCDGLDGLRARARSEPTDASAHVALAEALLTHGRTSDAVAALRLALGLVASKRDTTHCDAVAEAVARLYREPPVPGLAPEALPELQEQFNAVLQAVNAEYAHPALVEAFVQILDHAGKLALAERLCEDAMAKAPTAPAPYVTLAGLYRRRERFADAEAVLTLGEAARRPTSDACYAIAVGWAALAPHRKDAAARAKAELARALDACKTLGERRRLAEDFQLATGIQAIEP